MPDENHFDYIIIGSGLAGLQLALGFANDIFFNNKHIALIDPSDKTTNDKTWSFWEIGNGKWDNIIEKSWENASFHSVNVSKKLTLNPYTYKTIKAIDFYNFVKTALNEQPNFYFITDTVKTLEETEIVRVKGTINNYEARYVFDSRLPLDYFSKPSNYISIQQHFKGWVIKTNKSCFNPDTFTMMDYRYQYKNTTSFIYVLPFTENQALIEFTFFTSETCSETVYDNAIVNYIKNQFPNTEFKILETESGNIPMTDFPFWKYNTSLVTKIGTGGGWVKGSTGYSFKHTEKHVNKIINNIKNGKLPSEALFEKKYKFYDKVFLYVLKYTNKKGVWIFEKFYSKNTIPTMFRFLDEETSFTEDLKIMKSLFSWAFIKGFFRVLFRS